MHRRGPVPQVAPRRRHDVPELHGDAGRDAHHAGSGQRAPPDARRHAGRRESMAAARTRRSDGPLPFVQGLQERVPVECRHGAAQGGVAAALARRPRRAAAGPARGRLGCDAPPRGRGALGLQPAGSGAARLAGGKDGGRLRTRSITAHAAADHTLGVAATAAAARAGPERPRVPVRRRVHRHA